MAKSTEVADPPPATERRQRLTIASFGLLLFAVLSAASGQLLLKHGMQVATARAHASGGSLVIAAATSPLIIGGLAIFAISAVAWLATLAKVPLSVTLSAVLLHERTNLLTWAGSLVVVSGLIIVVLSQKS
jgi:drug/metabolite transporter (DMT)-like permease